MIAVAVQAIWQSRPNLAKPTCLHLEKFRTPFQPLGEFRDDFRHREIWQL